MQNLKYASLIDSNLTIGAFFNATFLLALALSIFLQSLERFISPQVVRDPVQVLIVGCVGLALNILSVAFLHGLFKFIIEGDVTDYIFRRRSWT